jgi:hypothetical protein
MSACSIVISRIKTLTPSRAVRGFGNHEQLYGPHRRVEGLPTCIFSSEDGSLKLADIPHGFKAEGDLLLPERLANLQRALLEPATFKPFMLSRLSWHKNWIRVRSFRPREAPLMLKRKSVRVRNDPGHPVRREFPIPPLVGGLPWRYAEYIKRRVVAEAEFAPLDLSWIGG